MKIELNANDLRIFIDYKNKLQLFKVQVPGTPSIDYITLNLTSFNIQNVSIIIGCLKNSSTPISYF